MVGIVRWVLPSKLLLYIEPISYIVRNNTENENKTLRINVANEKEPHFQRDLVSSSVIIIWLFFCLIIANSAHIFNTQKTELLAPQIQWIIDDIYYLLKNAA